MPGGQRSNYFSEIKDSVAIPGVPVNGAGDCISPKTLHTFYVGGSENLL